MSVSIKIEHVKKVYDNKNTVIEDLSLDVHDGEFFTLLGSSGCGKTTLLRMIAGFNSIEHGTISFNDTVINDTPIHKRNIGMVFQNYAVFPHMTVFDNVAYGLKQRKLPKEEIAERVNAVLEEVQIAELKDRYPSAMSGGQQQRIALARAIVIKPDVLLFDEPLSNLDAKLRVEMRLAIKRLQNSNKITTIYVTHDQDEALSMSDRIAVMKFGEIQQVGTPIEIYRKPRNLFVATFIGQSNVFQGFVKSGKAKTVDLGENGTYEFPHLGTCKDKQAVKVVVRPTEITFAKDPKKAEGIKGEIFERLFLGTQARYTVKIAKGQIIEVHRDISEHLHEIGEKVVLEFNNKVSNIFDAKTELSVMEGVK